jgi:FtsP/CotA-like multicopper oxidase with cupredoxin domain
MKKSIVPIATLALAGAALIVFSALEGRRAEAQTAAQLPLAGSAIPQWVDELPVPTIVDGRTGVTLELRMEEFVANVLPTGFVPPGGWPAGITGTVTWGYLGPDDTVTANRATYLGPIVLAERDKTTSIKYINNLGTTASSKLRAWVGSTDQTLHWADPKGEHMSGAMNMAHYAGPIPAVAHLHGGEVPAELDGGPDAWFLSQPAAGYMTHGHGYYSAPGTIADNSSTYNYPNTQEAANIWFHDHALGITRLNVYAGLAGAYLLADPGLLLPAGLGPHDIGGELIVPLVIQDRMFDTNGQLYFPNVGINMEHPYWLPEFVGDAIVVNGKTWPTFGTALNPKPSKRYRFLFLNGSNARTYELFLVDPVTKLMGPPMWVIGTDGGYLDRPVKIDPMAAANNKLTIMPGERYDVIIDLNDPAWRAANPAFSGQLILRNTGRTPYPKGAPPQGSTLGQVLKLFIGNPVVDTGYDPNPARGGGQPLRPALPRLVNPLAGTAAVTPDKVRQLTLNEVMAMGGPIEVLVNNTRWDGKSVAADIFDPAGTRPDFVPGMHFDYSEVPQEGETELWEIVNLTADAHPIHLHLVQFQLMNRQAFNFNKYNKAYNALFPATLAIDPMTGLPHPGGVFVGAYGPPLNYMTGNPRALGGNPNIVPYLQGAAMPPLPQEAGWKDTVIMLPGQVTRIMVRWAPTDLPANTPAADAYFPFDPSDNLGYVWHCHIIDHEDNEMMRPDKVLLNFKFPAAERPKIKGVDY